MNNRIDIPTELYKDEVLLFLADRYHTTSHNVVQCFLFQEGITAQTDGTEADIDLEDNEMEILRGLIFGSHS